MKTTNLSTTLLFNSNQLIGLFARPFKKQLLQGYFALILLFAFFPVTDSRAGVVTNLNNTGTGSLRAVLGAAVAGETITFSPSLISSGSATIVLTSEIVITVPVTINGLMTSTDTLFLSGNNTNRIFYVTSTGGNAAIITLNNLAFVNGYNAGDGGAIFCGVGYLRLNGCVFMRNSAMNGAAIGFNKSSSYSYDITATNCSFYNNAAARRGGAIHAEAATGSNTVRVYVNNSTIANNSGGWGASAIYCTANVTSASFPGAVNAYINMNQSTVTGNSGSTTVEVYTVTANNSSSTAKSYMNITNSTIVGSLSARGEDASDISIISSIVSGGVTNTNTTKIISGGYNRFSVASLTGSVASDVFGVSTAALNLSPLGYYGGPTQTRVPMPGSVAINNGSTSTVNAQNGPIIGVRDIGSAEQRSTFGTQVVNSCGPYTWINGVTYSANNNTATHIVPNAAGNDSVITLNLTIRPVHNTTASVTVCPGTNYTFGSQTLTASGTYVEVFSSVYGCDSTVTLTLTVADAVAPVPTITTLSNVVSQCSVTSLTAPTATDNCAGTITGTHDATLPITASGTTVVTWTFNDGNGNTSTQTQNIVINDNTAPVANLSALPNVTGQCSVTSLTAPTATDNCAGTITGTHNASLPITASGTTVVTWTYNDGHGNTATQTQNVIITDNTAPVANASNLADVTAQCSVTSLTAPTATDNCAGTITGTHSASLPITTPGTTVVTWTYNDGRGNSSTQTQNIIISDNTAPVANVSSLSDVTAQCSVTSLTAPTATDNCAGTITGMHNASLPITTLGTTVVTWTYNDGHGNSSTQTQNVVINDNTAPVANLSALADVTDQCAVTSLTVPTATDNCAGTITGTHNATLPITTSGTTVVTWTYADGNGNTSTQTQNVIISDNTAPVANAANLADVTAQCSVTSLVAPTATDNCAGTITGTHNASLPITTQGTTVITWTYNDGHGNTSTQTQNVIISDNSAPVATLANLANVTASCSVSSLTAPTATDNCAGTITGIHNVTLPITTPGTTVITWTYDDGHGNTTTQTQQVIVTAPVATTTLNGITISASTSGATYQWINCGNGNAPIAGATSQSFTATANGTYAVIVTQNGCSATSACVTISTVGLDEMSETVFSVYPNPNNGRFKVFSETPISILVSNAAGQEVLSQRLEAGENILELPNAESGIYFISASDSNGQVTIERVSIIK